jgi:Cu(I)/Ag(I) efflux system periplasmic protein CusF
MKKIIFIVFIATFFIACEQTKSTETVQTPKQTLNVSPAVIPSVSPAQTTPQPPSNQEVKRGEGIGIVTKINLELVSIELDHEEIKGMMPKMLMEFYVKDKKMLDGLKLGDKVDFTLEENKGQEMIVRLAKTKE